MDVTSKPLQQLVIEIHDAIGAGGVTAETYDTFVDGLCLLHGHERRQVEWSYWFTHHLTPQQQLLVRQGRAPQS